MNPDQPKPTTAEAGQAGEWTAEYVSELAISLGNAPKNVADAHNAAVAAERLKKTTLVDALTKLIAECKRQDIRIGVVIGDSEAALAKVKEGK